MIKPEFREMVCSWGIEGVDVIQRRTRVQGHRNVPFLKPGGRQTRVPFTVIFEIIHMDYADSFVSLTFQSFNTWNCVFYKSIT